MTPKEAAIRADKIHDNLQAKIESGRRAEAQRNRLLFDSSIVCGHWAAEQDYITVAEFGFQLCAECRKLISDGLGDIE